MKKYFTLLLLFASGVAVAATDPDEILGTWKNASDEAHVRIYKQNNLYYGQLVWLKKALDEKGDPKLDVRNPNKNLRNRQVIGMPILHGFVFNDKQWQGGKIYNPNDGKEYKAIIKITGEGSMSVRAYIGIPLFGKTEKFTRIQ